jgi:hypothetical protein
MNDISDLKTPIEQLIRDDADWFATKNNLKEMHNWKSADDFAPKYATFAAKRINKSVLELYGHRLSQKALETAYALSGDGWNLGPYELLETAQRLTEG